MPGLVRPVEPFLGGSLEGALLGVIVGHEQKWSVFCTLFTSGQERCSLWLSVYSSNLILLDDLLLYGFYCMYSSFAVDEDRGLLCGSYCISRLPLTKTVVCCMAVLYQSFAVDEDRGLLHGRTVSVVCR